MSLREYTAAEEYDIWVLIKKTEALRRHLREGETIQGLFQQACEQVIAERVPEAELEEIMEQNRLAEEESNRDVWECKRRTILVIRADGATGHFLREGDSGLTYLMGTFCDAERQCKARDNPTGYAAALGQLLSGKKFQKSSPEEFKLHRQRMEQGRDVLSLTVDCDEDLLTIESQTWKREAFPLTSAIRCHRRSQRNTSRSCEWQLDKTLELLRAEAAEREAAERQEPCAEGAPPQEQQV